MLGTLQDIGDLLQIDYEFGATNNNGNLIQQTIARDGIAWIQHYEYDGVNRLKHAYEEDQPGYDGFDRWYGYDGYGNRWISSSSGLSYVDSLEPNVQNDFNAANNRLYGVNYDDAGNQTSFGSYNTINYDAEGRISSIFGAGEQIVTFSYDGDGRRVKKVSDPGGLNQATYYFYDAFGQLAVEYSDISSASAGTTYPFADMLGSVRAYRLFFN